MKHEKRALRTVWEDDARTEGDMIEAWHFTNGKLRDGRELPPDGVVLRHEGPIVMCSRGLHASERAIDALEYAPGAIACRVRLGGEIKRDEDKMVASERTILWRADATMTLHEFACQCAEDALSLVKKPDPRSVAAIETKRRWMRGEATNAELTAAWAAARDAARDAALDAALAAARDAAHAMAHVAARDAAWKAAWKAGGPSVEANQNARLEAMLMELKP